MSDETAARLQTRNMQLRAAISAIRDLAEDGVNDDVAGAIKSICDEQLARSWDDPSDEEET